MTRTDEAGTFERIFVIITLLMFTGAIVEKFLTPMLGADSPMLRTAWLPFYGIIFILCVMQGRAIIHLAAQEWPLLLVLAVTAASIFWSLDPGLSARRFFALAVSTLFGLYLAVRFAPEKLAQIVVGTLWIIALGSFVLGLALPEMGRMQTHHIGAWNGMFSEKNRLGQMMVLFIAFSAFLLVSSERQRLLGWAGIMLGFSLIVLSQSMTALIAAGAVIGAMVVFRFALAGPILLTIVAYLLVFFAVGISYALIFEPESIFALLGREASLTGRADIWADLGPIIKDRLWSGYGYGAFWEAKNSPAMVLRRLLEWDVPSAHNGWLELMLQGGIMLVTAFALHFGLRMTRALATLWNARGLSAWSFVYLVLFLVFTLSESSILQQNDVAWVLYVTAAASLMRYRERIVYVTAAPAPYPGLRARLRSDHALGMRQ